MKAAKGKTFWLLWIASAILLSLPALASSVDVLHSKTRAELIAENGHFSIEPSTFYLGKHVENYDRFWGTASDSPVAPRGGLPIINPHFVPKPGIGTKAVTASGFGMGIKGGIAGKPRAALMIDGKVYVHHHHLAAQELAGTVPKPGDLYGFATLDKLGNVISVDWMTIKP